MSIYGCVTCLLHCRLVIFFIHKRARMYPQWTEHWPVYHVRGSCLLNSSMAPAVFVFECDGDLVLPSLAVWIIRYCWMGVCIYTMVLSFEETGTLGWRGEGACEFWGESAQKAQSLRIMIQWKYFVADCSWMLLHRLETNLWSVVECGFALLFRSLWPSLALPQDIPVYHALLSISALPFGWFTPCRGTCDCYYRLILYIRVHSVSAHLIKFIYLYVSI